MKRGKKLGGVGISKISAGVYCVRVSVVDPSSGRLRERQQKIAGKSYEEAEKARDALRDGLKADLAAEAGGGSASFKGTLAEFAPQWLEHLRATRRCRPHAIKKSEHALASLILPALGNLKVHEITRAHAMNWLGWLGKRKTAEGAPYATETLRGAWQALRTLLRDAVPLCGLVADPTAALKFSVKGTPARERIFLSPGQLTSVLRAAADESVDVRAMIFLGFSTGLRFCELSALTWDDVNLSDGFVSVRRSQVNGHVDEPKSKSSKRIVPLLPAVIEVLHQHRAWQQTTNARGVERGIVFLSRAGTYRTPGMLRKPLRRCAELAGIPETHLSSHVMRRTFNNLARSVADRIVLQSMTGHSTESMSFHYSSVSLAEKKEAQQQALGSLLPLNT